MKNLNILRWTGIGPIIAAVALLANQFIEEPPLYVYGIILVGSLIGFLGLHQFQKDTAGTLSLASILVLLLTFLLYGFGRDDIGDIVYPISFLLLGAACYQSGKFPRWAALAVILATSISLFDSYLLALPKMADVTVAFIFAAGFSALGLTLWQQPIKI